MASLSYRIGRLTLIPGRHLLRDDETMITIGSRALEILALLAEHGGRLVHKDEILATVWNGAIVEDNALQAQISAVRRALGPEAVRLSTVHGRGYRLMLDASGKLASHSSDNRKSLAVLPFDNLTGDRANDYLADGLSEELIATLSKDKALKVPARTSSFAYRAKAIDVREIARELGVAAVLEGSVRAAGRRLRATALLIDAESGFHIWSQSYDRPMTDLLALQDDLAHAIAGALRHELSVGPPTTSNSEAMRLVLQARASSRTQTPLGLEDAERAARKALAIEPLFAKAWEALAGTRLTQIQMGFAEKTALAEVRTFAQQAHALDPALSGPLGILGSVETARGRLEDAIALITRAIEVNPANPLVWDSRAFIFLPAGLSRLATLDAERSIAQAPARPYPRLLRAMSALVEGDMATAKAQVEAAQMLGLNDASALLSMVAGELAFAQARPEAAASTFSALAQRELALPDAGSITKQAILALAEANCKAAASADLAGLFDCADASGSLWNNGIVPGLFVRWHAGLNDLDAAFRAANRIIGQWRRTDYLSTSSLIMIWLPSMAEFRADFRFSGLLRDLGLYDLWACHGRPDCLRIAERIER